LAALLDHALKVRRFHAGSIPQPPSGGSKIPRPTAADLMAELRRACTKGCWACSSGCDCRLVFEFQENPKTPETEILLPTAGTHAEVS
jgi:hypothetical protein